MRLLYILMAAVSTLSVHQVPVTASVGGDVALTGVMSLGFLHLVGADENVRDQSRFLRGNNLAGDKEERGWNFVGFVEKLMTKIFVDKLMRTQSFSALEKVDDLAKLDKYLVGADDHLVPAFKFADDAKMGPRDMANELKKLQKRTMSLTQRRLNSTPTI
ncbi:RxLR effector protein [Phytophthora megakarya]|uniref:RxLR effector protein n=1 Tax=Phytophthora megakarya TaxID=4795 RepID=A0A225V4V6_9STRA|nr:RxLR effector protein [Phytophthora megakarya]